MVLKLAPFGKRSRWQLKMVEPDGSWRYARITYLTRSAAQDAGRRWRRQKEGRRFRTEHVWV